jgi:hypothetical protein
MKLGASRRLTAQSNGRNRRTKGRSFRLRMQSIGLRARRLLPGRSNALWTGAGVLVAIAPALWMWGFTVDDALIPIRYSRHIAAGLGWYFNASGPSTDGVTPLPWPVVLAPLAHTDALKVLLWAKGLGLAAWALTGGVLGRAVGHVVEAPGWARALTLATMAMSVPLGAYAVAGMETPLATLLATCAAIAGRRPRTAAILAGVAASLRPEMAPWALVLGAGVALAARESAGRVVAAGAIGLTPFALCAALRCLVWGRPIPLAVLAKPSDIDHGLAYAVAALVVTVVPILAVAPLALVRSPRAIAIGLAALAHAGAIVAVGGDWMPYGRLWVPVVPSLAYAAVLAAAHAHRLAMAFRSCLAIGLGGVLLVRNGDDGRHVGADRRALVVAARPWLANARRVAALDVGWVSAATDADVIDLAGLTDPEIAALPGGHTSKRVDVRFLLDRDPDALLLYAPLGVPAGGSWRDATYPRVVEARLAQDDRIARQFAVATWLALAAKGGGYVLLEKR